MMKWMKKSHHLRQQHLTGRMLMKKVLIYKALHIQKQCRHQGSPAQPSFQKLPKNNNVKTREDDVKGKKSCATGKHSHLFLQGPWLLLISRCGLLLFFFQGQK